MKLDVEGYEPQVIKGAERMFRTMPPRSILTGGKPTANPFGCLFALFLTTTTTPHRTHGALFLTATTPKLHTQAHFSPAWAYVPDPLSLPAPTPPRPRPTPIHSGADPSSSRAAEYTPGVMERKRQWGALADYPRSLKTLATAGYRLFNLQGTTKNMRNMDTNWTTEALPSLREVSRASIEAEARTFLPTGTHFSEQESGRRRKRPSVTTLESAAG